MQCTLAYLVSIPAAVLLQRTQLPGSTIGKRKIEYRILDNAFGWIADFTAAQKLADEFGADLLHRKLDEFAARFCPVVKQFDLTYHWSLDQVEFATDIVFGKQSNLQAIYERLTGPRFIP